MNRNTLPIRADDSQRPKDRKDSEDDREDGDDAYTAQDADADFEGSDYESDSQEDDLEDVEEETASESETDDDDDDEYEDEADKRKQKKRKASHEKDSERGRRRPRHNPFVELEAQVGDEEEEEEEEGEPDEFERQFISRPTEGAKDEAEEEEEEQGPTAAEYQALMRQRYLERQDIDAQAEEQRLRDLYGRVRRFDRRRGDGPQSSSSLVGDERMLAEQVLQPTPHDPRLWLVKCRLGKERAVVHQLLRSHLDAVSNSSSSALTSSSAPLQIFSALAVDGLQGHVYVEAHKAANVAHAVDHAKLTHLCFCGPNGSRVNLVPQSEMTQVLSVAAKKGALSSSDGHYSLPPLGSFVRIRRGRYAGDLAQVIEVPEDDMLDGDNLGKGTVKLRLVPRLPSVSSTSMSHPGLPHPGMPHSGVSHHRMSQRLFEPGEMNVLFPGKVQRSRGFWLFDGDAYKVSDVGADGRGCFLHKDVRLSALQTDNVNAQPAELAWFGEEASKEQASALEAAVTALQSGDGVIVTVGEFIHLRGIVLEVLQKRTGNEDHSQEEDEEASDADNRKTWVKLQPEEQASSIPRLDHVLVEADAVQKFFSVGDSVQVMAGAGKYAGALAMVVHYVPNKPVAVFIPSANVQLDVDARYLKPTASISGDGEKAEGGEGGSIPNGGNSNSNPKAGDDWQALRQMAQLRTTAINDSQQSLTVMRRRWTPREGRHLIGRTVSIAFGPYKGYVGIVKDVTEQLQARVELHTNSRLITVPLDKLILPGSAGQGHSAAPSQEEQRGAKTPTWTSSASKTPSYNSISAAMMGGGKTPAWRGASAAASQTPSWTGAGGRTPSWKTPGAAKTPGWEPQPVAARSKTPAWAGSSAVPLAANSAASSGATMSKPTLEAVPKEQVVQPTGEREPSYAMDNVCVLHLGQLHYIVKVHKNQPVVDLKSLDPSASARDVKASVPLSDTTVVRPQKRERAIIYGDGSLLRGQVIGLDDPDAVVKIDGTGEFRIVKLAALARLHQP
jgi:transcription elongation factor SPT5